MKIAAASGLAYHASMSLRWKNASESTTEMTDTNYTLDAARHGLGIERPPVTDALQVLAPIHISMQSTTTTGL